MTSRTAAAALLGAAAVLLVSGCTDDPEPAQLPSASAAASASASTSASASASTSASASVGPASGPAFSTDGSMPAGYPAAMPKPVGTVTASRSATRTGDGRGWTVVTRVDSPVPKTYRLVADSLADKGFRTATPVTTVGDAVRMRSFADEHYAVNVTVSQLSPGQSLVNIQVSPRTRQ